MDKNEKREYLAKLLFDMNQEDGFRKEYGTLSWNSPAVGFAYDQSRDKKLMNLIMKDMVKGRAERDDVICYLCDWETVGEGIVFTTESIIVKTPKNSDKDFYIDYNDIDYTYYENDGNIVLEIHTKMSITKVIDYSIFSRKMIGEFLDKAIEIYKEKEEFAW